MYNFAKLNLSIKWFDGRLTWMNLVKNSGLNILQEEEISMIWIPDLVFTNTADDLKTVADNNSMILVEKLGGSKVEESDLEETAYHKGSECPLVFSRNYNQKFACNFKLHKYPFDVQRCHIFLAPTAKDQFFTKLIPESLEYSGPVQMITYTVEKYTISRKDEFVVITIELKRLVSRHLLSTYLPSLCILVIAQVLIFCFVQYQLFIFPI